VSRVLIKNYNSVLKVIFFHRQTSRPWLSRQTGFTLASRSVVGAGMHPHTLANFFLGKIGCIWAKLRWNLGKFD